MKITELLHPSRIACRQSSSSKKRSLDTLSRLLADATTNFTEGEIFDSLVCRERLGSTGLGNGVALPHGRIPGLRTAMAALIILDQGVDFDAIDHKPVDLLFALLVPEASTDEHLRILANVAQMFSNPDLCASLRASENSDQCYKLISNWTANQQISA